MTTATDNNDFGIPTATELKARFLNPKSEEILKNLSTEINKKAKPTYNFRIPHEEGISEVLKEVKTFLTGKGYEVSFFFSEASQDGPYYQAAVYVLEVKVPGLP